MVNKLDQRSRVNKNKFFPQFQWININMSADVQFPTLFLLITSHANSQNRKT